jgi:hypothetical protein
MTQKIVYKTEEGLAVINPTESALAAYTIQQIAAKDVPSGLPYKIVEEVDIPSDRTFREAWTIADSELTDGTGADHDMFDDDPAHPNYVAPAEEEYDEDEWNAFVAANGGGE